MGSRLLALALALLARLGLFMCPQGVPRLALPLPPALNLTAGQLPCTPGLPGEWTPMTGGEP